MANPSAHQQSVIYWPDKDCINPLHISLSKSLSLPVPLLWTTLTTNIAALCISHNAANHLFGGLNQYKWQFSHFQHQTISIIMFITVTHTKIRAPLS